MNKYLITVAALAATFAVPAFAEVNLDVTTVGVIDSGPVDGLTIPNVSIETVASVSNPTKFAHGSITISHMAKEFNPAATNSLKILYASPFEVDPDAKNKNETILDWSVIVDALIIYKKAGVKYVCTTFVGADVENATKVVNFANQLGITIVASMGNGELETPYPAMLPGVVAVVAKEYRLKQSDAFKARVDVTETGIVNENIRGSSYAAAKVCGQIAAKKVALAVK